MIKLQKSPLVRSNTRVKIDKILHRPRSKWFDVKKILNEKTNSFLKENPHLKPLHEELSKINKEQLLSWPAMVYCDGSFYQGYEKIGVFGVKPVQERLTNYDSKRYIKSDSNVLDIGSNAGFLACEVASQAGSVTAVEYNPFLNRIGRAAAEYLSLENISFIDANFENYSADKTFDCVFSLSNHHTIDGGLNISFDRYIRKIFDLTKSGATFFFESHNIWGDDKDLEKKFDICSKYFLLKRSKMVKAFYKPDIDKLFAVFERRESALEDAKCSQFNLAAASKSYQFIEYDTE